MEFAHLVSPLDKTNKIQRKGLNNFITITKPKIRIENITIQNI